MLSALSTGILIHSRHSLLVLIQGRHSVLVLITMTHLLAPLEMVHGWFVQSDDLQSWLDTTDKVPFEFFCIIFSGCVQHVY